MTEQSYARWLPLVAAKLRTIEGDHMVASTKFVKRLRSLARMHAYSIAPSRAAWLVSAETDFAGREDYD